MEPADLAQTMMDEMTQDTRVTMLSDDDYIAFMDEVSQCADVNAAAKRDELP